MADDHDDDPAPKTAPKTAPTDADITALPQWRQPRSAGHTPFKRLGVSPFSARFGAPDRQATGHWCSVCRGIWFGYPLEVSCPVCGNRRG
jgi:hypothetical protein